MQTHPTKILVVDDEEIVRESCRRTLEGGDYLVTCAPDGATGLRELRKESYGAVITDLKMPGMSGLEFLSAIRQVDPTVPVIVITAYASVPSAAEAVKRGAVEYVRKPFTPRELLGIVGRALDASRKSRDEDARGRALDELQRTIQETLNLQEVLQLVAEGVVGALNAKGSVVSLLDPGQKVLRTLVSYGLSPNYLNKGPVGSDRSIQETFTRGRAVWVEDVAGDPRVQYPQEALREGIRSILSVPILHQGTVIGALRIYTAEVRRFTEQEVRFVCDFSEQVGVAIEHALSYQNLLEERETLREDLWEWYEQDVYRLGGIPDPPRDTPS